MQIQGTSCIENLEVLTLGGLISHEISLFVFLCVYVNLLLFCWYISEIRQSKTNLIWKPS